jgi:hypothetical protein
VVDGARIVVGSDPGAVRGAIQAARPAPVAVTLVSDAAGLAAQIGAADRPVAALLVFYEPQHLTAVANGENGGRQLREYRIVRSATPLGNWDGSARRLPLASPPAGLGAAVLVQGTDLRVLGAGEMRPATS